MRFIAIEYTRGDNNNHVLGYIRIPDSFSGYWTTGYIGYITDTYKVANSKVDIYPLNVSVNSDTMGKAFSGYTNLEDDFIMALRSTKYYPQSPENDRLRREWAKLDSTTFDFTKKER